MLPDVAIRDVRFLNEFVETARVLGHGAAFCGDVSKATKSTDLLAMSN
jgi:hypothetical protein